MSKARRLNLALPKNVHLVTNLWPFRTWGIDILQPFTHAARKLKFLVVTIEYFTNLIEQTHWSLYSLWKFKTSCGGTSCV